MIDLPIRIPNEPAPKYIKRGDTRGKWVAKTKPGGLLVGLVQSVASPTGFEPDGNHVHPHVSSGMNRRKTIEGAFCLFDSCRY